MRDLIFGKTGTTQNPHGDDHSIYIAFAQKNDPEIAIAVLLKCWLKSKWAAPIGNKLFKYFELKINEKAKAIFNVNYLSIILYLALVLLAFQYMHLNLMMIQMKFLIYQKDTESNFYLF